VDLAVVTASGTVRDIRHIPMALTGWGVGVIALGRCWRIGLDHRMAARAWDRADRAAAFLARRRRA
jgi:hypothetical protein